MNILFINSSKGWGGGEVWLTQIGQGLVSHGHKVSVICRRDSDIQKNLSGSSVKIIPLRCWGDFSPNSIWKIYRIIRKNNIDIVCTNWEKDLRLGGIASFLAGVPIVPSREVDVPIKNSWVNRLFYKHIASAVLVNSFATFQTLLKSAPWLNGKRVQVIWKGVETGSYCSMIPSNLKREFHLNDDDILVGFVGRLDEQKGIDILLQAMRLLVKRCSNLKLVLIGEGNLRGTIEQFTYDHGLERYVFLKGFVKEVGPLLKAIDFLVMPSYWEGFGYAALEAMAVGKAVVATRVSSLPEIIRHDQTGILVPTGSPELLAEAMLDMCRDSSKRTRLGQSGLNRARIHFSLSMMIDKTEKFFTDVVRPCTYTAPTKLIVPRLKPTQVKL